MPVARIAQSWLDPRHVSQRDAQILERTASYLRGHRRDFGSALRALQAAVEETIPDGRVFVLGATAHGPIVGSIISGIGIVDDPLGVRVVRARPGESIMRLAVLP